MVACQKNQNKPLLGDAARTDTARIHAWYDTAWMLRSTNPKHSYHLAQKTRHLSKSIRYDRGEALALRALVASLVSLNKFDSAFIYSEEGLALTTALQDDSGRAWMLNLKGLACNGKGNYKEAGIYFTEALTLFEKTKDTDGQSRAINNIGITHYYLDDYTNALTWYLRGVRLMEEQNDQGSIATALVNVGIVYRRLGNLERAEQYYNRALGYCRKSNNKKSMLQVVGSLGAICYDRGNLTQSEAYHLQAVQLSRELGDRQREALAYSNLGAIEQDQGDLKEAIRYFEMNIAILNAQDNTADQMNSYVNLVDLYIRLDDLPSAKEYAALMERVARETDSRMYWMNFYQARSKVEYALGDFKKAYHYSEKFHEVKDSLFSKERIVMTEELAERYESERKEQQLLLNSRQIEILRKDSEKKELQLLVVLIGALLIVVISIMSYVRYRERSKRNHELAEKNNKILELDLKNEKLQRDLLEKEVEYKNQELTNLANFILEKESLISTLEGYLGDLALEFREKGGKIQKILSFVAKHRGIHAEREELLSHIRQLHESFYFRLEQAVPDLSVSEKRLCALLRLNLSSKQIATLLNISPKSVDMNRYRLRKKLGIASDQLLTDFVNRV
jgi:tetratricopeptide (TPR) repeat protein